MSSPEKLYEQALLSGVLQADEGQAKIIAAFDELYHRLENKAGKPSLLSRLKPSKKQAIKGLYIYGGVGRGKTLLMDLFYTSLPETSARRLHFHDFMVMAHDEMNNARLAGADDLVSYAAARLAEGPKILCFDEMEVRDIADAMILKRLFDGLFHADVTVIATSNRHPDELYLGGLHRDRFLPFIDQLKDACDVIAIDEGQDWRTRLLAQMPRWSVPANEAAHKEMKHYFNKLVSQDIMAPITIKVAGREIILAEAGANIAFVHFDEICGIALAARDYIAVADRLTGLFITDIPLLDDAKQNEARRFMWLVDALYDRGRFLVASAAADMDSLYTGNQWAFEFDRTVSRLSEMTRLSDDIYD